MISALYRLANVNIIVFGEFVDQLFLQDETLFWFARTVDIWYVCEVFFIMIQSINHPHKSISSPQPSTIFINVHTKLVSVVVIIWIASLYQ